MKITRGAAVVLGAGAVWLAARLLRKSRSVSFHGMSVVITGGSRGLGLVLARQLAAEGARLTLMARDTEELERAAADPALRDARVITVAGDVGDKAAAERAIARAVATYGRIDVLINNAGIIQSGPLDHMNLEDFAQALAVHFWGPLHLTLAALPHMRRQGGGRIVNISSIGGEIAVPHLLPYSASKFALVGLSDGLRAELARDNILVTTVVPGLMRTGSPMNALFKGRHSQEMAWFTLFDALPFTSIDARRAAHQIIEACRVGAPYLRISIQAQLLVMLRNLAPGLHTALLKLSSRLLPPPTDRSGDRAQTGWQSQSPLAPSILTRLSDRATVRNNGVPTNQFWH